MGGGASYFFGPNYLLEQVNATFIHYNIYSNIIEAKGTLSN